jgi:hypothetical protein
MNMRVPLLLATITVCVLSLVAHGTAFSQSQPEKESETAGDRSEQTGSSSDDQEDPLLVEGYPDHRDPGNPGSVERDLNTSFPKKDSVFGDVVLYRFSDWKERLYEKHGIKLAFAYQGIAMTASQVVREPDYAAAGWLQLEFKWDAVNRGKDFQGGLVLAGNHVHTYGNAAQPAAFFLNTGSLVGHDGYYLDLDWIAGNLYWEQWFKKDRLWVRLGQQLAIQILDFHRYADWRTSFSGAAHSFPVGSMPYGPPGLGVSSKWWPVKDSELYVVAVVNDINSFIDEVDFRPIFDTGDVFAGAEVGYNWKRMGKKGGEMDHVHLTVFYGDEPTEKPFPSEAGWGAKIAGEKQWGKLVGFGNYAYNNAKGGGFGVTTYEHVINAGVAYNNPLGIRGEVAAALTWVRALDGGGCGLLALTSLDCNGDSQALSEFYWKILLTPALWVTPGLQFGFDPVGNPDANFVAVPTLKFRASF